MCTAGEKKTLKHSKRSKKFIRGSGVLVASLR